MKLTTIEWILFVLLVVGGLNWGLVGIADFDLVAAIFGDGSALARIVYGVVGISAISLLIMLPMKSNAKVSS